MSENKEKETKEEKPTEQGYDIQKGAEEVANFCKRLDEFERQSREKEIMVKQPK